MMKKSKKNINRREIRRRRQLKAQRQRALSRDEKKYIPEEFGFWTFISERKGEIFFVGVLIAVVWVVTLLGPDKKAINEIRDSVSLMIEDQSQRLEESYPYGFKIIALTGKDIIHTSFDTLPPNLDIDWKNFSVVRVKIDRLRGTSEKIEIMMEGINYAPAGIDGLSIKTTFSRKKGAVARLTRLGKLDLVAEVIDEKEGYLFFLLGLR